ncbi:MAG: four helix bundle protein [Phycisphaeraceae bacterium]
MNQRFDHEKLDVYRLAIEFVGWTAQLLEGLDGPARHPRDQLLRSSQSIAQNIAEGNGKRTAPERRRYFEIARGSAMESAATLDILIAISARPLDEVAHGKGQLYRLVQMLSAMTRR